jgi:uncharacterized membrane protein
VVNGEARSVERRIGRVLLWGGLLSGALMLGGLALSVVRGLPHSALPALVSLRSLVAALGADPLDPVAVITLGIALLLATPVVGVATAVPGFLREGDRQYATIALIVLAMLLTSTLLAIGAG